MDIKVFSFRFSNTKHMDGNPASDLRFLVNTVLLLKQFLFGLKEIRKDKGPLVVNC